jgi:MFS family permease
MTIVAILPTALLSAMVVQIGSDIGFGAAGLGAAVTTYWLANACASVPLGRVADRLGAVWSLRAAVTTAFLCSLGIATLARTWWHLAGFLVLGGVAHAFGHPGANRLLVNTVDPGSRGFAFGLKGAAAPAASMLAGLGVPVVALTIGWRWAFGMCAALALALVPLAGRRPPAAQRTTTSSQDEAALRRPWLVFGTAASFALGTAASMSVSVFYVDSAVASEATPRFAGVTLAIGSCLAVVARLVTGAICDRMASRHMELCALMQLAGLGGIVLMATGQPVLMAGGVSVALVGLWGINAVFWYALLRHYHDVPGRITGAVQPGGAVGGVVGPFSFGLLVQHTGYLTGWVVAGATTLVAAMATYLVARALRRGPAALL